MSDTPRALRQSLSLRLGSAGFLALWCLFKDQHFRAEFKRSNRSRDSGPSETHDDYICFSIPIIR